MIHGKKTRSTSTDLALTDQKNNNNENTLRRLGFFLFLFVIFLLLDIYNVSKNRMKSVCEDYSFILPWLKENNTFA